MDATRKEGAKVGGKGEEEDEEDREGGESIGSIEIEENERVKGGQGSLRGAGYKWVEVGGVIEQNAPVVSQRTGEGSVEVGKIPPLQIPLGLIGKVNY